MKKNMRITKYLIVLTLVFSIIGYANNLKAEQETPQPIKQKIVQQEAIFSISELTELSDTKGLVVLNAVSRNISDDTKGMKLLITMKGKTKGLFIYDLGKGEKDGEYIFFQQGEEIFSALDFDETQAIILTTNFPNSFPQISLEYFDNHRRAVELYISESGEDGSILFVPKNME